MGRAELVRHRAHRCRVAGAQRLLGVFCVWVYARGRHEVAATSLYTFAIVGNLLKQLGMASGAGGVGAGAPVVAARASRAPDRSGARRSAARTVFPRPAVAQSGSGDCAAGRAARNRLQRGPVGADRFIDSESGVGKAIAPVAKPISFVPAATVGRWRAIEVAFVIVIVVVAAFMARGAWLFRTSSLAELQVSAKQYD